MSTASLLVGAALLTLLALALATVALGVVTALKVNDVTPKPITPHGRWELRRLPDGTHEYTWIARQAGRYGPEIPKPPTATGRHRIPT
ncbi:hypothetical protein [Kitasatospora sp. NPDC047058]|uniref:hypothetical protein n=1 Tax=Kitasatospora sp. NPDC047058 TaxID=3155620 RepID=UPI0033E26F4A